MQSAKVNKRTPSYFAMLTLLIFCGAFPVNAEIQKSAIVCDEKICLHWWPKLQPLVGWHQDEAQSLRENVNALAPNGSNFVNAETVMYVNAIYKPRVPESKNLNQFIENDKKAFELYITEEVAPVATADGQKIKMFKYSPKSKGNWEEIGYGEEGDYYLVFALSSRTSSGRAKSNPDFVKLISTYHK